MNCSGPLSVMSGSGMLGSLRFEGRDGNLILHDLRWLSGAEANTSIPSSTARQDISHQSPPTQNRCLLPIG